MPNAERQRGIFFGVNPNVGMLSSRTRQLTSQAKERCFMKKNNLILLSILAGLIVSLLTIARFQNNAETLLKAQSDITSYELISTAPMENKTKHQILNDQKNILISRAAPVQKTTSKAAVKITTVSKKKSVKKVAKKSPVQLLDWWKSARFIFTKGRVAEITDVRTGRTFKIIRTMGTNHADCEALTKKDAQIIKSIWGGFNWNVRPVIVKIGNRRLAASMSSMPHAGVDSRPAYAMVSSRSGGYSRGENLDVIKGNGMDGHFDVHFLNSTRHKDGKKDPRHQAAIKIAARSK